MRLFSYHILRKGGEGHKRGTEGGVECMSNRHIIPAGEHGQRIWGAARKGIKKQRSRPWGCQDNKNPLEEWLNKKGSSLLVYIHSVDWSNCCLYKTWNNWLTVRVLWLDLKYCYLPKPVQMSFLIICNHIMFKYDYFIIDLWVVECYSTCISHQAPKRLDYNAQNWTSGIFVQMWCLYLDKVSL